jgi:hypothetical protein
LEEEMLDAREEELLCEWAPKIRYGAMNAFNDYFGKRCEEIAEAFGHGLDTADDYLNGFAQGMQSGLDIAQGLIYVRMERLIQEMPPEDATNLEK